LLPPSSGKKEDLDGMFLWNIGACLPNYDITSQKDMMWKYFDNYYQIKVSYEEILLLMDQVSWSQDSSVDFVTRLRLAGARKLYVLLNVQTSSGACPASYSIGTGELSDKIVSV
jgi:hypothetical protein